MGLFAGGTPRTAAGGLLVGIDVGTSGLRAVAIDEGSGSTVAGASEAYPLSTPRAGWAEQDPADYERALTSAMRTLAAALGPRVRAVRAIGLSGQMHSAVLLDEDRQPVRPAILWCDTRTREACEAITARLGSDGLHRLVGNRALEGFTLPKLLWLRQHEPSAYERVDKVLMPKDYVAWLLTRELSADVSDASGTLAFDPAARVWSQEMLDSFDVPRSLWPHAGESCEPAGRLTSSFAEATGFAAGTIVARGAADNAAGAVGLGVVRPGRALVSIGTSGVVLAHLRGYAPPPDMKLHTFAAAVPGEHYAMGVISAPGAPSVGTATSFATARRWPRSCAASTRTRS